MDYLRRVPLEILRNDTPRWLPESCSYPVWARVWFRFAWCVRVLVCVPLFLCVCVCVSACRSKGIRCLLHLADRHTSETLDVTAVYYTHKHQRVHALRAYAGTHQRHFSHTPSKLFIYDSVDFMCLTVDGLFTGKFWCWLCWHTVKRFRWLAHSIKIETPSVKLHW